MQQGLLIMDQVYLHQKVDFSNYCLANYKFEIEFSPIKRTKHWNSSV